MNQNIEIETFKQNLRQTLEKKGHLGIVEVLDKINQTLSYEQYDRTKWVSMNSQTSPITLELLSASLVQAALSLIMSIKTSSDQQTTLEKLIQANLANLDRKLDLSNSGLRGFQAEFELLAKSKNLEILDLRNNDIQEFPAYLLQSLSNLKELYLQGNPIKNIPREIFDRKENVLADVRNYFESSSVINKQAGKTLCVIVADLQGSGVYTGSKEHLAKVTNFFLSLKTKYFANGKEYFLKLLGNGFLVTGHNFIDIAQKAIAICNETKNYAWKHEGFTDNLNVRLALHIGEGVETYKNDGTILDISGIAVTQATRFEPYAMVGEVFCSQTYADLLAQDMTHTLATFPLGKYKLGKTHDIFELAIAVLFTQNDKEVYEDTIIEKCKRHLIEKTSNHELSDLEISLKTLQTQKEIFEKNPNNPKHKYKLALFYAQSGENAIIEGELGGASYLLEQGKDLLEELYHEYPNNSTFKETLADIYFQLGARYYNSGDLGKALVLSQNFNQLREELLEENPKNADYKQWLAISYSKLGEIQTNLGNLKEALALFEKENSLFQELLDDFPNSQAYQDATSVSFQFLGRTLQSMGELNQALACFEKGYHLAEELYNNYPDFPNHDSNLSIAIQRMGEIFMALGNFQKALEFSQKQHQIIQELYEKNAESIDIKHKLALSYQFLGQTNLNLNDYNETIRSFEKFYQIEKELNEAEPRNISFRQGVAIACLKLGEVYRLMSNFTQSFHFLEENLRLQKELYESFPSNIEFKDALAVSYAQLGEAHRLANHNIEKVKEYYSLAKQHWTELNQDVPDNVQFIQYISFIQNREAELNTKPLHQAKMLLIGNGNVGKSSILFRLNDKTSPLPPREATPLIDVQTYIIKDIPIEVTNLNETINFELKVWDFGGQGKYREIQNLFCTQKSLYVYVTSPDDTEDAEDYIGYEYWLSMAQTFGKEVKTNEAGEAKDIHQSPLIHIVNKCDLPDFKRGKISKNLQNYIEKWGNAYLVLSCEKVGYFKEEFESFEEQIKNILPKIGIDKNDVFNQRYSLLWFAVKEELEKLSSENYISYQQYTEICEEKGVSTNTKGGKSEAQTWLDVLHRIGVVIYFGNNPKLKDWIITNPNWIRKAFAEVVDNETLQEVGGKLTPSLQKNIWQKHTEGLPDEKALQIREKFIALMLAYDFCYEHLQKHQFIPKIFVILIMKFILPIQIFCLRVL
ncbi:MAG: hypothetical protein EAZ95_14685 [Bacteroidetes bacterium]|nr:MAG: hypothetical protein EAZ95_14685 [Bacteroidota bacterium]